MNKEKSSKWAYVKPECTIVFVCNEGSLLLNSEVRPTPGGGGGINVNPPHNEDEDIDMGQGANPAKQSFVWDDEDWD